MKRIWINRMYIAKLATKWTSLLFAFLGLIGTFTSLSDLIDSTVSIQRRIVISITILAVVWGVFFIVCAIYVLRKRRFSLLEVSNGYHVYVQYGDVFNKDEIINPNERRNIVIPVNRCFDTLVDDDLVSSKTLHGIAMNKLYSDGCFNQNTLNEEIQKNLAIQMVKSDTVNLSDKRSGNLRRFPVGTVSEISSSNNCTYFFLGLSTFDSDLHAHTSDEEYVLALIRLLEFCNKRSQKFPVVMPLIGAGASETNKSERDILEYIVKLIKMNKKLVNCDIHIVVRDNGKESIAITDLK